MQGIGRMQGCRSRFVAVSACALAGLLLAMTVLAGEALGYGTYDVRTYGARGDGVADDSAAIQRAIDAAAQTGGAVVLPAGTFRVESVLRLSSGVTVSGVAGSTVLHMSDKLAATPILYGENLHDVTVQGLTLRSNSVAGNVYGVVMKGAQSSTLNQLRFENLFYGIKLGTGNLATGWTVTDITMRHVRMGLFLGDVHDSTFRRLDLEGAGPDGVDPLDHPTYIYDNVWDCVFEDLVLSKPSGYAFHIWAGGNTGRLTFRNVVADASDSGSPMVISGASGVEISNLTAIGANRGNRAILMLASPQDVLIEGFNAEGCDYLIRQYGGTSADGVTLRNGNFNGVRFDYGSPATRDLTIESSVSLNGPAYAIETTTTLGPSTSTTVSPSTTTTTTEPESVAPTTTTTMFETTSDLDAGGDANCIHYGDTDPESIWEHYAFCLGIE